VAIVRLGSHRKLLPPINYAEKLLYKRPVSNGAEEIGPQPNGKSEKVQEKWGARENGVCQLLAKVVRQIMACHTEAFETVSFQVVRIRVHWI